MSFYGILTGNAGSLPNPPTLSGAQTLDPRDRGLGANVYTSGGGVGTQQTGAPYVNSSGTGGPGTHSLLMVAVLLEVAALIGLRHLFRNYHGG